MLDLQCSCMKSHLQLDLALAGTVACIDDWSGFDVEILLILEILLSSAVSAILLLCIWVSGQSQNRLHLETSLFCRECPAEFLFTHACLLKFRGVQIACCQLCLLKLYKHTGDCLTPLKSERNKVSSSAGPWGKTGWYRTACKVKNLLS